MAVPESKNETMQLLASINIPFYSRVPLIEEGQESKIRSSVEIAKRILVLSYLCYLSEVWEDRDEVVEFLKKEDLWASVSSNEQKLFLKEKLTEKERINISWRPEGIWLLLFVIHKIDQLALPQQEIKMDAIFDQIPDFMAATKSFINAATLRPTGQILDAFDLIYRIHWAVRDAQLNNSAPLNVHPGIVFERHYAINWVLNPTLNWDDVTTDT